MAMKPLILHPRAVKDAREIAAKYEAISERLVERFWAELDEAIDRIESHPELHHYDPSGRRRSNLKKFPYHILFEERLECNRIVVIRHHHRHPGYGLRRQ
jgi:plasmid stabilization system protein ParE